MWKVEKLVKHGDYMCAVVKDHPHRMKNNYVLYHRIVMENHLGRLLNSNEVVHHKDGNKFNNDISNLELLTVSEHTTMHQHLKGRKWVKLKCPWCGKIFERGYNNCFLSKGDRCTCCSRSCHGKLSREIQLHGLTHELETAISENLIQIFKKYADDNSKETSTSGSLETIRSQAEMPKK